MKDELLHDLISKLIDRNKLDQSSKEEINPFDYGETPASRAPAATGDSSSQVDSFIDGSTNPYINKAAVPENPIDAAASYVNPANLIGGAARGIYNLATFDPTTDPTLKSISEDFKKAVGEKMPDVIKNAEFFKPTKSLAEESTLNQQTPAVNSSPLKQGEIPEDIKNMTLSERELSPLPQIPVPGQTKEMQQLSEISTGAPTVKAEDEKSLIQSEATQRNKFLTEQQDILKKYVDQIGPMQKQMEEKQKQMQNIADSISQVSQIDPGRIFHDTNLGGKISFLISAAAGGLETGGALSTLIQNDIAAQIKNQALGIDSKKGLIDVLYKQSGNLSTAINQAREFMKTYIDVSKQNIENNALMSPAGVNRETVIRFAKDNEAKAKLLVDSQAAKNALLGHQIEVEKSNIQAQSPAESDLSKISSFSGMQKAHDKLSRAEEGLKGVDLTSLSSAPVFNEYIENKEGVGRKEVFKALTDVFKNSKDVDKLLNYADQAKIFATNYIDTLKKVRGTSASIKDFSTMFAQKTIGTREGGIENAQNLREQVIDSLYSGLSPAAQRRVKK